MGMWDRLGNIFKSYLNDFGDEGFHFNEKRSRSGHSDPDLDAAYEELDDYLQNKTEHEPRDVRSSPPEELLKDFAELGLSPEASFEECKTAYKKLLKIHHPDRHSKHQEDVKKATEKSVRVNAAYRRLENWYRRTG